MYQQDEGTIGADMPAGPMSVRPPLRPARRPWRDPRHVARELHDRVGNELAVALRQLELAEQFLRGDPDRAGERLARGLHAVSEAMRVTRELSGELSGAGALGGRLADDLRAFADSAAPAGTHVLIRITGEESCLTDRQRGQLFLIVCELLRNSFRHAEAGVVMVGAEIAPAAATAVVEDNGRGFDQSALAAPGHGFGLISMRERARNLGGTTHVQSTPGHGTRATVRIPLTEAGRFS